MKNFLLVLFGLIIITLGTTGFKEDRHHPDFALGSQFPEIKIFNDSMCVWLGDDKSDSYVLISFWRSTNAQSRIQCKTYNDAVAGIKAIDSKKIEYVAVNLDPDKTLSEEIIKCDNLNSVWQYSVADAENAALKQITGSEFAGISMLVDRAGTIIAYNPSVAQLGNL